jgi:hypothetical protein
VTLFDENFEPGFGFGSESAFVKKAGSGSAYNECGSETLVFSIAIASICCGTAIFSSVAPISGRKFMPSRCDSNPTIYRYRYQVFEKMKWEKGNI